MVELGQHGKVVTNNSNHVVHGSETTFDETLQMVGGLDDFVMLNSDQYTGIDRVVTGKGNDFVGGSLTNFNAFEATLVVIPKGKNKPYFIPSGVGRDLVYDKEGDVLSVFKEIGWYKQDSIVKAKPVRVGDALKEWGDYAPPVAFDD